MILRIDGQSMADFFNGLVDELDKQFGCDLKQHKVDTSPKDFKKSWDLPGIKKEEIKISIEGPKLSIDVDSKKRGLWRSGAHLPRELYDHDKISAKFEDGVLEISVPLKTSAKTETKVVTVQ